ncbi:SDR family oxidoreductase [Streptomyces sp. NBC_01429]|uniref:SDR family oxidoreductase n=1 Tax=Streptomyces sp. NBC_01429 TaxID=2903862 RepID=UPI002E29416A|nr:SDR family oxidoreductase [Streptomyces sp. NBC_01429]
MVDLSGARRLGTPEDIVSAAAFLAGPDSAFITGNDLLVDGGAIAARRWNAAPTA